MYQGEGYKTVTPTQLCNVLAAQKNGLINFKAARVFFACLELAAIREAAGRQRAAARCRTEKSRGVRYRIEELERVTGLSPRSIKKQLAALEAAGVLLFGETCISLTNTPLPCACEMLETASEKRNPYRAIPIPRSLIHFIAAGRKPALAITLIAYMMRGLSLRRKDKAIRAAATAKASWVAETFGLSLRAVRAARRELTELGIISEDQSTQRKLNRTGSYFQINTAWRGGDVIHRTAKSRAISAARNEAAPVDNVSGEGTKFAPLQAEKCTEFAPPYKDLKTPYGLKNQKTRIDEHSGFLSKNSAKPNLKDIKLDDLHRLSRLEELYEQATAAKWLPDCEANLRNFIAAAVRATRVSGDAVRQHRAVRIFVGIVRRGLWHHITQEQEDRAVEAIKRYREKEGTRLSRTQPGQLIRASEVSQMFVKGLCGRE